MPLADALRNPWGILHGGAVASLIDVAAEHVTGGVTTDVVLHFLAPNRVGPVRANVRTIGSRADGTVLRVEVRDEGADRVTALGGGDVVGTHDVNAGWHAWRVSGIVRPADDRAHRDRGSRGTRRRARPARPRDLAGRAGQGRGGAAPARSTA